MQYQVLALKWRPQSFDELVGQEYVSRTLINALQSGRVAHAFLFSGPRGSGKTSTARLLAKALNCHEGKPGEPCGRCVACTEIAAGGCMDVLEIDAASTRGIDDIRELREKARYNPARDRYKIFIIDEVHMLTPEAFNALLKTLEEPPPHVVFILATTEYHKIPATILSRCQQYSFKLIQYPLILDRLRKIAEAEGIRISDPALEQVVFSSGGSMRDAMSALDQVIAFSGSEVRDEDVSTLLGLVEPRVLAETTRAIAEHDPAALFRTVAELVEAGQDLNNFCRRLSGHFRNLMILKVGISDPALLGIPESVLPDLRAQAELFSREDLLRLFDAFQKVEAGMKYAAQVRFQLEMGLVEMAHIARLRPLEELVAEFSAYADDDPPGGPGGGAPATRVATEPPAGQAAPGRQGRREPLERSPAGRPAPQKKSEAPASARPHTGGNARELLESIVAALGREALEFLLQSFAGARLEGDRLILDPGEAGEFARHQVARNLEAIAEAAASVVGRKVSVTVEGVGGKAGRDEGVPTSPSPRAESSSGEILERARREPVVQSFLDAFPGPVKAEKLDE
ncbi:MAG: DNA polymerase III subunit gamma/tau [Acidobacteriota bacterium]|jgi:DNA polymerase-3 subunit gamma/tau|nr:DNA polymerase III subunit gamma/tau [Acidobacteriota bacterium]